MNPILRKANLQGRFHHAGAWRVQRQVTPHGYKGLKGSGRKRGLKSGRTCGHDDGDLWDLFSETLSRCHQSPLDQITRMDTGHRATSPPPTPTFAEQALTHFPHHRDHPQPSTLLALLHHKDQRPSANEPVSKLAQLLPRSARSLVPLPPVVRKGPG